MAITIRTQELPIIDRPPQLYEATVSAVELATSKNSGEPFITITVQAPYGKRFGRIHMKSRWFEPSFRVTELNRNGTPEEQKAFRHFTMVFGGRGSQGELNRWLGRDFDVDVQSVEQLRQTLEGQCLGRRYWFIEKQETDEAGVPTQNYKLSVYWERPKRLPANTRYVETPHEAGEETHDAANSAA